jgi:hypothetical protein
MTDAPNASPGGRPGRYLAAAFRNRWNLAIFGAATALAALSPMPDVFIPIITGLEGIFLLGLVSRPKFREAIDARDASIDRDAHSTSVDDLSAQLQSKLPVDDRQRFQRLVERCREMQTLALTVRSGTTPGDDMRASALNRLLFFYLRLLVARRTLREFLAQSNRLQMTQQRTALSTQLATAEQGGDGRVIGSLRDTIKDLDMRIANFDKGDKDFDFLELELTRIEGKVHALAEAAITRQDPAELSAQVNAFADTLQMSQDVATQMISLEDLELATTDAPRILESTRVQTGARLR